MLRSHDIYPVLLYICSIYACLSVNPPSICPQLIAVASTGRRPLRPAQWGSVVEVSVPNWPACCVACCSFNSPAVVKVCTLIHRSVSQSINHSFIHWIHLFIHCIHCIHRLQREIRALWSRTCPASVDCRHSVSRMWTNISSGAYSRARRCPRVALERWRRLSAVPWQSVVREIHGKWSV